MELPKPGEVIPGHKVVTDIGPNLEAETKVVPWTDSAYLGEGSTRQQKRNPAHLAPVSAEQAMIDQLHQGLPEPVRRTSRERYETLVLRLLATARETKLMYGYVCWPNSIQKVLDSLGVKRTASEREQVYALAKHYIVKAENQQKRKDYKKVVSDWHGHFD